MRRIPLQWISLAVLGAVIAACSNLKLLEPLRVRQNDWPTYGGSNERTNDAPVTLTPPLKEEWECDISAGIGNGSPLIVDSVLFIGNLRGELYAIAASTGKRLGAISLGEAIQGSPVIDKNFAIVASSGSRESLIGYDLLEGIPRWKRSYGDIEASLTLVGQKIYVGNTTGTFFCVDRGSGDKLWSFELPDNRRWDGIRSTAAAAGKMVIFGADDGAVYALDAETGHLLWRNPTGAPVVAPPAIFDSTVLVGNLQGRMVGLAMKSGATRWSFTADGPIRANPARVDGMAIFGTLAGSLYSIRAEDGSLAWRTDLGSPVDAAAAAADNVVYIGTLRKTLACIRASDGTIIWNCQTDGRIKTSPAIAYGRLYVATDERLVISFREAGQ